MLQRLFGEEYSERLIREALFDLPHVLAAERRGDLSLGSYQEVRTPESAPV